MSNFFLFFASLSLLILSIAPIALDDRLRTEKNILWKPSKKTDKPNGKNTGWFHEKIWDEPVNIEASKWIFLSENMDIYFFRSLS